MAKYFGIWKCRLCGALKESTMPHDEDVMWNTITNSKYPWEESLQPSFQFVSQHMCDELHVGLADFVGFRMEETDAED